MTTWADAPPPVPGSPKAINQHKAMAQGYVVTDTADRSRVKTYQEEGKTGVTHAPGLTSPNHRMRMPK